MSVLQEVLKIEDEQMLKNLNRLIVGKLNSLRDQKNLVAKNMFRIGDEVTFTTQNRGTFTGKVEKINPKTIKVRVGEFETWKVSPAMLRKMR